MDTTTHPFFTSGATTKDPAPYVVVSPLDGSVHRVAQEATVPVESCEYDPRPEYDNHNPILTLTRSVWPGPINDGAECVLGWRNGVLTGPNYTEAQRNHAHRVLTKLAGVYA